MKRKILLLIGIVFLVNGHAFSTELSNSKQVQEEQAFEQYIEESMSKIKSLPYKLLMLDELYLVSEGNEKSQTTGKDILRLKAKYQNNKQSDNYIYCEKAYSLYVALCSEIVKFKDDRYYESPDIVNKKIYIPNTIYNKLDKDLVHIITLLNVVAEHL